MVIKILTKNKLFSKEPYEYLPGYTFVQDSACEKYDWLVVFDEPPLRAEGTYTGEFEPLRCPREHTMLLTWEPVSIKNYCSEYVRQFGHLLTNRPREAENHPNYHRGLGYFPWYNGRSYEENRSFEIPPKTKVISAICSSKAMKWTNHFKRIQLLQRLKRELRDFVWYGHGVEEFDRKCDAMDEYKYHVTLENHIGSRYWTEKIMDAYLCECLPIYSGAPDLFEDFPRESYIPISLDDMDAAVATIKNAIENDEWSKRIGAIREAKKLMFEKYNFWAQIIKVIEECGAEVASADTDAGNVIYSRKYFRKKSIRAKLEDGWFHLRQYLGGLGLWPKIS